MIPTHDAAPILEFDPARKAVIEPDFGDRQIDGAAGCILAFLPESVEQLVREHNGLEVGSIRTEMGHHPIWMVDYQGTRIGIFSCGVGAPLAVGMTEELIGRGFHTFVACGSCGVLDADVSFARPVVVTEALRDEGTSYHYLPAARWVSPDPVATRLIAEELDTRGIGYVAGKTWTTDGFFRETPEKVARRREEGCLTVEMEASALFALARFRDVRIGQLLYGGDDVSGETWDPRLWIDKKHSIRFQLLDTACAALVRILASDAS